MDATIALELQAAAQWVLGRVGESGARAWARSQWEVVPAAVRSGVTDKTWRMEMLALAERAYREIAAGSRESAIAAEIAKFLRGIRPS